MTTKPDPYERAAEAIYGEPVRMDDTSAARVARLRAHFPGYVEMREALAEIKTIARTASYVADIKSIECYAEGALKLAEGETDD